jgi:predicted AAA+ superfamily ATPase
MERGIVSQILKRLSGSPSLIQIVIGPRQVGKTTADPRELLSQAL